MAAIAVAAFAPQTAKAVLEKAGGDGTTIAGFLPPTLPEATEVKEAHWLDQSWSDRERFWFHHTSQGTATLPVPYDWFLELERPELSPFAAPGRLADTAYLQRYGFTPSPPLPKELAPDAATEVERYRITGYPDNRDGLPVGFARMEPGSDPTTRAKYPALIGLTCAGCHSGHLEYKNVSIRFDGGPAMTNLVKLEEAVVLAVLYTLEVPGRFDSLHRATGGAQSGLARLAGQGEAPSGDAAGPEQVRHHRTMGQTKQRDAACQRGLRTARRPQSRRKPRILQRLPAERHRHEGSQGPGHPARAA